VNATHAVQRQYARGSRSGNSQTCGIHACDARLYGARSAEAFALFVERAGDVELLLLEAKGRGWELAEELKQYQPHVRVLFMCGGSAKGRYTCWSGEPAHEYLSNSRRTPARAGISGGTRPPFFGFSSAPTHEDCLGPFRREADWHDRAFLWRSRRAEEDSDARRARASSS
jgi:hypothetical protein